MVKGNANKTNHITNHSYLNYILKLKKIYIKINYRNVKNEYIHLKNKTHYNHLYLLTAQYNTNHLLFFV